MIALLAVAFSFAYLPSQVFHLALAGVYVIAPYIAQSLIREGWPWPLAICAAMASGGLLSAACEALNHHRLDKRSATPMVHFVSSLGIYILLSQAAALIWGNDPKTLRTNADSSYQFLSLTLARTQAIESLASLVLLTGVGVLLRNSDIGLRLRGLADNPREMLLAGVDTYQVRLVAFGISGILAASASLCMAYDYGFDPNSGLSTLLLSAVAVMVGGQRSFWAPVVGGIGLGILRSEVVWYLSARWQEPLTFIVLSLVLLFRPYGFLGEKRRLEAQ
jgi:branched-chain amino acid transport system permease protein